MNKENRLARRIATIGILCSAMALCVFIYLYFSRIDTSSNVREQAAAAPVHLVAPSEMGKYGELMFAYIGADNLLYNLDDESSPLIDLPATELLYASDDSVLFTSGIEINGSHPGLEYAIQELQVGEHYNQINLISEVSLKPCWSSNDEVIYFVNDDKPATLCTFEPLTSTTEEVATFEQRVSGLRISSDGLLVLLDDGAELQYVPLSHQLVMPNYNSAGKVITVCEQYDLLLSSSGELYYRWQGSDEAVLVSSSALIGISHQDNELFYIAQEQDVTKLMAYYVAEENTVTLCTLPNNILPQLSANAEYAMMIDAEGVVYLYDVNQAALFTFTQIDTSEILAPMISLFDYRLMVYDLARPADSRFVYAVNVDAALSEASLDAADDDVGNMTDILSMGAHGETVSALQQLLLESGYYSGTVSGFYDEATMYAVMEAQEQAGMRQTGVATPELNAYAASIHAKPSVEIEVASTGTSASMVQHRLWKLGYTASRPSVEFNETALQGLALFASDHQLDFDDHSVSTELQQALFSNETEPYQGYLTLHPGDTGIMVPRIEERLIQLGYMSGYASWTVSDETMKACASFGSVSELPCDGSISGELQAALFSDSAPSCPDALKPTDALQEQVSIAGQTITDRQIKVLRKWLTKSFAVNHTDRQAIKRLQMRLLKLGYLIPEDVSMVYDAKTGDAVMRFQHEHSLIADGIPNKRTLMSIFGISNMTLTEE